MVMTNKKLFPAAESKLDKNYYLNDCKFCGEFERERDQLNVFGLNINVRE